MQVGISIASAHPGVKDAGVAQVMVERAKAAARAGLSCLTLGDHHVTGPVPYAQNVPMLARLLAEWDDRPAGCLFLVPAWNPVLMAEQIGTLAAIARGPFIVQTGLGDRHQLDAMGVEVPHRGQQLEATIKVVQALLAGERVDQERLGIRGAAVAPRPPRRLEWWIGAHTEPALDRAARLGDGWYGDAGLERATARDQLAGYRAACERHGREPGRTIIRKDVLIADDDAHATRMGQALIDAGYRGGWPRESVAFGDPEHVAEQLAVFAGIGFSDVIIRVMTPVPQEEAIRTIELAGKVSRLLADR